MVITAVKTVAKKVDSALLSWYVSWYPWSKIFLGLGETGIVLLILVCCIAFRSFV
jgi:hypothetical protein